MKTKTQTILGIDLGATFTDAVLYDGKIIKTASIETTSLKNSSAALLKFLQKNFNLKQITATAITGGKPEKKIPFPLPNIVRVNELQSIATGACLLAGKKKFIVANIGTGTPILLVDGKKWGHLGGTGIGGGTIAGLGKLLLNATALQVEQLALNGKNSLDLSVGEIIGSGIGIVPANATASNFAKAAAIRRGGKNTKSRPCKEDIAYSLLNLVAETVARMTILAAKQHGCEKQIVFTGRVASNKIVAKRLRAVAKMFSCKATIPKNAPAATAVGAAKIVWKNR